MCRTYTYVIYYICISEIFVRDDFFFIRLINIFVVIYIMLIYLRKMQIKEKRSIIGINGGNLT